MRNALYKTTALSALALAGIACVGVSQPAAAQTSPPPLGGGGTPPSGGAVLPLV